MRSSAILGGTLLAVVGLLLVLARGCASASKGETVPREALARAGAEPVAVHEAGPAESADNVAAAPSSREAAGALLDPATTCRIRVVERATHAPVPATRVWIQRDDVETDSPLWRRAMRRFNDLEPVLASGFGQEFETDAEGSLEVPLPRRARAVAAARGELHGEAALEAGDRECLVELTPAHSLDFEVVDRTGRPIENAHVALYWGDFDPLNNQWTWITDATGRAHVAKLEAQLWPKGYHGPVRATLGASVPCEPTSVLLDLEALPKEPVRFVAGDFGRLVLQSTDDAGAELALDGRAFVDFEWPPAHEPTLEERAGQGFDARLESGRAVFGCFGLGLDVSAYVTIEGYTSESREGCGPREPGEEVLLRIPLGHRRWQVRGSVQGLDAWIGDLRPRTPSIEARLPDWHSMSWQVTPSGSFVGSIFDYYEPRLEGLEAPWSLRLSVGGQAVAGAMRAPTLDTDARLVDFGPVVFEAVSELARVAVRDVDGAPVSRADIEIDGRDGSTYLRSDEAGSCSVRGPLADLPLRLCAKHPPLLPLLPSEWETIAAPGAVVTLTLRPGASVEGVLLLPRGAHRDDFDLTLRPEPSADRPNARAVGASLVEGNRFRLGPCEAGRASLSIDYDDTEVFQKALELDDGETTLLEPIDLAAVLHPFALTFELASGEPWRGGHLQVREADGELSTRVKIGPDGRAVFLARRASVDLWAVGKGGRAQRFEGVGDGDRLVLPAAPAVVLRLPREVVLPPPPFALCVRGSRADDAEDAFEIDDDVDVEEARVGVDGTVTLRLSLGGRYELDWYVCNTRTGEDHDVEPEEPQTIEVGEASAVQVVEARLRREDVERAVLEASE